MLFDSTHSDVIYEISESNMSQQSIIDSAVKAVEQEQLQTLQEIGNSIIEEKRSETFSQLDKYGRTPLNMAIDKRNVPCARYLLEDCHVDPMVKNEYYKNYYPLTFAAVKDDLEIVKLLFYSGAKLNLFEEENYISPLSFLDYELFHEPKENYSDIVKFLIEKGEDINRSRCLIIVILRGNVELVKYILDCGADVNVKYDDGFNPLFASSKKGNVEIAKLLLDRGANHEEKWFGLIPPQWAALRGHTNVVNFYLEEEYYTHEKMLDCIELLGVKALMENDVHSAVDFWNKVTSERPEVGQANSPNIFNNDHFIGNTKSAAIHSIMILEKVLGTESHFFFSISIHFLDQIPIENVQIWETILCARNKYSDSFYIRNVETFVNQFKTFSKVCKNEMKIDLVMNMVFRIFDNMFKCLKYNKDVLIQIWIPIFFTRCNVYICSKKDILSDDRKLKFYTILKRLINSDITKHGSLIHTLIKMKELSFEEFQETLELFCRLTDTVNILDDQDETPLYLALRKKIDGKCINILLKYGALTPKRYILGISIKEWLITHQRQDLCLGSPPLQILINSKRVVHGHWIIYKKLADADSPKILNYFTMFNY